jgi:DNA polymerase III delta prime subunit
MKKIGTSSIWYEKYKPQCIDDVILPEGLKQNLKEQLIKKDVQNFGLFSSNPGTGKSTLSEVILKELKCDAKWINASLENGIDVLRNDIFRFATTGSSNDELKVVVLDEADYLNANSTQPAFRGFLDEYSKNCRFIFTGNYKEKIIEPLLNRLQVIDFNSFKKEVMHQPYLLY